MPRPIALDVLNRLLLSAQLIERGAMRSTPAGLPAMDLVLKHASTLAHHGQQRLIVVELKARVVGELVHSLSALEIGSEREFSGFIGGQRNGRGVVFHVTEFV